jgi:hypothetical protein
MVPPPLGGRFVIGRAVSAFLPRISLANYDAGNSQLHVGNSVILDFSITIQGRESPLSIVDALEICHFVTRPAMRTEGTRTFWSPDLVSRPAKLDPANSELPFTHNPRPITGANVGLRHFRPLTRLEL